MPASTPWWSTPSIAASRPSRRPTLGLATAIVALIPLTSRATMADPLLSSPTGMALVAAPGAPWQPRASRIAGNYAVYSSSYGIEHGTCERSLMRNVPATAALPADSAVGHGMDRLDRYCVGRILEYAPDHKTVHWYGGTGGYVYAVMPTGTYQRDGRYCRDFQASARLDSHSERLQATACRAPDGSWHAAISP